jgi:uncharacterized protein
MKLHLSRTEGAHQITGYGPDYVAVNGVRYEGSLVVTADTILTDWAVDCFADLSDRHVARLVELQPELVLLGTGTRTRFPSTPVLRPLIDARIGYEIMDTGAACRTFGVLNSEGRRVLAALLLA